MNINKLNRHWDSSRDDYSSRTSIMFQREHLKYLNDCKSIIDLGCGNGQLVRRLRKAGKEAHGFTYNTDEVRSAVTKYAYYGDMHDIPSDDDVFEAFIMWDSLEHCQSAYIALCEAKRVIRDNGKGLIFMPGQNWLDCHCHICCYTVPQMKQLFKQAGLKLINVYEKKYPMNPTKYCEGMAVYEVMKYSEYAPVFNSKGELDAPDT